MGWSSNKYIQLDGWMDLGIVGNGFVCLFEEVSVSVFTLLLYTLICQCLFPRTFIYVTSGLLKQLFNATAPLISVVDFVNQ